MRLVRANLFHKNVWFLNEMLPSVAYQSTCTFMGCALEGVGELRGVSKKKLRDNGAGGVRKIFPLWRGVSEDI